MSDLYRDMARDVVAGIRGMQERIRTLEAANTALTEAGVRVIAQRDALEAELAENREVQRRALQIIEFADGHPDMCCGKCSREIHEAERERDALAEQNRVLLDAVDRLALTNAVVEAARDLEWGNGPERWKKLSAALDALDGERSE